MSLTLTAVTRSATVNTPTVDAAIAASVALVGLARHARTWKPAILGHGVYVAPSEFWTLDLVEV